MTLDYTRDFINRYYINLKGAKSCEDAYNLTEKDYYYQYQAEIKRGRMKDRKFKNYKSFTTSLYYHIRNK